MKKTLAIDVGGTCLDLFALNGNSVFCFKELCFFRKSTPASARSRCLGFAPRSESFAIEPSVQVCSISSLSGLALRASSVRKSAPRVGEGGIRYTSRPLYLYTSIHP